MSTVKLKTIEWSRCFSFGDNNKVDLNGETVTQIIGPNGFGKSSIPLIIEEALFNKNSKGVKKEDIPNRLLNDGYDICLPFEVDNDLYEISITRKSSVKVKLTKNGEDISSHTATNTFKQFEEIIGMDFKTFQQLIYQSTNSSLAFLTATDTARKKFLIDLFDLSEYTERFELFKKAVSDLTTQTNTLEGTISTITKWMSNNSNLIVEYTPLVEIPIKPDFSNEVVDLTSKISGIESHNAKILRNNSIKAKMDSIDIESIKLEPTAIIDYGDKQEKLGNLQSEKAAAEAVVKKLRSLDNKCPTCLQDVDKKFSEDLLLDSTITISTCDGQIALLNEYITSVKKSNSLAAKTLEYLSQYESLESQYDPALGSDFLTSDGLEQELKDIKSKLADAEYQISNLTALNNEATRHNHKIDIYLEQNEQFSKDLDTARAKVGELSNKLKSLEVLKKAFSANGLTVYKLENLVKDLEVYTNEYLGDLSDGRFTIEFSISSDKLNVTVTDQGKEISINAPSSGEMARINISTLLAIRKLMSGISRNTINVLFLDEVISVLDDYGRERLVEVLLRQTDLNTFLVSHSWTHPLVDKLVVRKKDGISWIDHG